MELVEVFDVIDLATAVERADVRAVAIDATASDHLADALRIAGQLPVLRPPWRRLRNSRGEVDEVFDGYGLQTGGGVESLPDGALGLP